jgi:trans-AT polyketide synthase/acyltransferase/oxidoreductase domain-containing protein
MGAFNEWVKGSFLEPPENRKTVSVAMNLLYGAAVITRLGSLRNQGADLSVAAGSVSPISDAQMQSFTTGQVEVRGDADRAFPPGPPPKQSG